MIHPDSWTAKLYHRVPPPIAKWYRKLARESERRARERFRKEWRNLEEILSDPKSTEQEKRLARMELMAMDGSINGRRAAGEDE